MADNPRRGRDRGGYGGRRDGPRDNRRDDPDHARYQDRRAGRDRDDRHRTRSASPRRERRDRSRDRRDRDRDHGRDSRQYNQRGDRGHDRGYGGRDRDRDYDRRRRDDRDEPRPRHRDEDTAIPSREGNNRREGSPPRRANPSERNADLPTRSKQQPDRGNTPLSFRVGKGDETSRGSQSRDVEKRSEERRHTPQHEGDTAMGDRDRENENEDEDEDDVDVEADMDMAAMMGFGGFGTTKGAQVKGNNAGAVRKEKKTEYRQYMNRIGGFNRPLSPGHH
ncbi:hypothetical protein PG991_015717 [Apiospora marii]|uniref:U4/U6.U5 small nuclear ribonucleoprotein 27kDa protein domain-containing protein n=1 Tax=Apiospora marii TaxID=335849 RepID=A0ABR1R2J9_9PEZI